MSTFAGARVLRIKGVMEATGLGRSSIYVYVADGLFPRPRQLGPRAVGWLAEEVFRWIAEREVTKLAHSQG